MRDDTTVARRNFFVAGGAGAMGIALAGLASAQTGSAQSNTTELSATEKANLELVHTYDRIVTDSTQGLDRLQRLKEICSPNMIWGRVNGDKFLGLNAVIEWYQNFFNSVEPGRSGMRILKYEYSETWVKGPVIVEYGVHLIQQPGGPPPPRDNYHVVVWVIRDKKLAERYDHFVR